MVDLNNSLYSYCNNCHCGTVELQYVVSYVKVWMTYVYRLDSEQEKVRDVLEFNSVLGQDKPHIIRFLHRFP